MIDLLDSRYLSKWRGDLLITNTLVHESEIWVVYYDSSVSKNKIIRKIFKSMLRQELVQWKYIAHDSSKLYFDNVIEFILNMFLADWSRSWQRSYFLSTNIWVNDKNVSHETINFSLVKFSSRKIFYKKRFRVFIASKIFVRFWYFTTVWAIEFQGGVEYCAQLKKYIRLI